MWCCGAQPGEKWVGISVQDNGVGLSQVQRAGLFEPFNRLGAERSGVEGSGLGLAIRRQLVALMGGTLQVDSEPGRGSCFSLQLPACAVPARVAPRPAAPIDGPATLAAAQRGQLSVLYVEDNPINLVLMEAMMSRPECAGVTLHTATDGLAGLAAARRLKPERILLDLSMPGMDGRALPHKLRAEPALAHIACVAVSANALTQDIETALQDGFHDYMTKPFTLRRLAELVDHYRRGPPAGPAR